MAGLPFHPEQLTEQQRPLGFAGSPRGGQSATAGEFRDITWNKTDLVHDFHSFYLFDFRNLDEVMDEQQAIRFLSSNSHVLHKEKSHEVS
jgi:hypothetical protein